MKKNLSLFASVLQSAQVVEMLIEKGLASPGVIAKHQKQHWPNFSIF